MRFIYEPNTARVRKALAVLLASTGLPAGVPIELSALNHVGLLMPWTPRTPAA